MKHILTVGHSNISWDEFHYALDYFDVDCIVDVRSSPSSRWPQFKQKALKAALNRVGISYVHLGDTLGGHPKSGPQSYAARRDTPEFANGVSKLLAIAERCRPALMCSEGDPLHCHRFLLISRHLASLPNIGVWHIRHNGTIEGQAQTEDRMLALHQLSDDLLLNREEMVTNAYARQERKLG